MSLTNDNHPMLISIQFIQSNFAKKKPRSLSPRQPRPASLPHSPRHLLSQDDNGEQTSQLLQHGSVGELENSTLVSPDFEENRLKADNEQKRYEKLTS